MVFYILHFSYSAWGTWGHQTNIVLNKDEYDAFWKCQEDNPNKKFSYYPDNIDGNKWVIRGADDGEGNRCEFLDVSDIESNVSAEVFKEIEDSINDDYLHKKVMKWMEEKLPIFYCLSFTISGDDECQQDCLLTFKQYRIFKKKKGFNYLFLPCGWKYRSVKRIFCLEDNEEGQESDDEDDDYGLDSYYEANLPLTRVFHSLRNQLPYTELDEEIHRWLQEDASASEEDEE